MKEEKTHYADYVTMTEVEYTKLLHDFGLKNTRDFIERLDNYKGARGRKYKSDYRAILCWVVQAETGKTPAALREERKKKQIPVCKGCGKSLQNELRNHSLHCYGCDAVIGEELK